MSTSVSMDLHYDGTIVDLRRVAANAQRALTNMPADANTLPMREALAQLALVDAPPRLGRVVLQTTGDYACALTLINDNFTDRARWPGIRIAVAIAIALLLWFALRRRLR